VNFLDPWSTAVLREREISVVVPPRQIERSDRELLFIPHRWGCFDGESASEHRGWGQTGPDRVWSMGRFDIADDAAPTIEHVQPPFNARNFSAEVARDRKRNRLERQATNL
jgi:hypothetical protein